MGRLQDSDLLRFYRKLDRIDGCWIWNGKKARNVYGGFYFLGKWLMAHRVSYEHFIGVIPEELVIDHLCRNKLCVNPDHLEAVSGTENTLRGIGPTAINAAKTECIWGHEFSEENTRVDKHGYRICRTCQRVRKQSWKNKQQKDK